MSRTRSRRLVGLVAAALCLCAVMPVSAHTAAIEMDAAGTSTYKTVRLTPEIYNHANSDLSDLRVLDGQGEAVPYFVNRKIERTEERHRLYGLEQIDGFVKDDAVYFDYRVADEAEADQDVVAKQLVFITGHTNFAKDVDVYGSYDGENWTFVQADKLYVVEEATKLEIDFVETQKYTHYRVKIANNQERVGFSMVCLRRQEVAVDEQFFVESIRPVFTVEEDAEQKVTRVRVEGLQNLNVSDITIETDSMFKRQVLVPPQRKELYNLALNGVSYADTTIPVQTVLKADSMDGGAYVLTIHNNDDKPIEVKGITARYYADEVVFEAREGESYRLSFGADAAAAAPVYDIVRYQDEILKGAVDRVSLGDFVYEAVSEASEPETDYSMIFNGVIVGVAVLLGVVILLRLRNK